MNKRMRKKAATVRLRRARKQAEFWMGRVEHLMRETERWLAVQQTAAAQFTEQAAP